MAEVHHLSDQERHGRRVDGRSDPENEIPSDFLSATPQKEKETVPEAVQLSLWDDKDFLPKEERINVHPDFKMEIKLPEIVSERVANVTQMDWRAKDILREKENKIKALVRPFLLSLHEFLEVRKSADATREDNRELCDKVCVEQEKLRNALNNYLVGEDEMLAEMVQPFLFLSKATLTNETFNQGMDLWENIGTDFSSYQINLN